MPTLEIAEIMKTLAGERPLFHSEADFQHALAWKIHELFPEAKIRLEVSSGRADKRERIDIMVGLGDFRHAIELKYKKRRLDHELNGEIFALANDGAQDIGRYDYIKDIVRLEQLVSSEINVIGHAILLTNDDLYWRESLRSISSAAILVHEGRTIRQGELLSWHETTGDGTKKGRTDSFQFLVNRSLSWTDYSQLDDTNGNGRFLGAFRYLYLKTVRSDLAELASF